MDLRFALRVLWKDRGFALTTAATLALCLAANIAIYAIVHAVLLRPLPFPEPAAIVTMYNSYPGAGAVRGANGVPDYYDRLAETDAFEDIALYRTTGLTIGGAGQGDAERVAGMPVTPSFFRLLGAEAARGRLFEEADAEFGQHRKVVLSHGLWQRVFGGRDDAVGADLRVDGLPYQVVGILPPEFRFVSPDVQLWTVAAFRPEDRADDRRHSNNWQMIARLRPGTTVAQAQAQIDALNARNLERFPFFREVLTNAGFHTPVFTFHDELVRDVRPTITLVWGGVLVVLLIGGVNVANLASVRAAGRLRELATRVALGAGVGRLARQLLAESLLLAAVGAGGGLALAWWALQAAPSLGLDALPLGADVGIDTTVALYAVGLAGLVGLLVGLVPVLVLRRANVSQVIRDEGRSGTASRGTRMAHRLLVMSQVAFALVLLVGAGLLVASFDRLMAVDPGFRAEGVLTGRLSLPAARYAKDADVRSATTRLLEAVRAVPGVSAAGMTTSLPLGDDFSDSVIFAEGYQMAPGESVISPTQVMVSPGYPEAMGLTLVDGRWIDDRDVQGAPRAILVDERLAARFWPGERPVGRRMFMPSSPDDLMAPPPDDEWLHVVGVVRNARLRNLAGGGGSGLFGTYYLALAQFPARGLGVAVRTDGNPAALSTPLRAAIAQVDPELPFYDIMTMTDRVERSLVDRRTPAVLVAGFSIVALLLSALGLYGVLAYGVRQRTREIGVRMALGAGTGEIVRLVIGEGGLIVGVGVAVGLAGAVALRGTLQSQLYEIGALDPGVIGTVVAALLVVALIACLLPARRAAATDPVVALTEP
ncbi:MAG: ABC transporter permease [Acidobacteriota bacterium]